MIQTTDQDKIIMKNLDGKIGTTIMDILINIRIIIMIHSTDYKELDLQGQTMVTTTAGVTISEAIIEMDTTEGDNKVTLWGEEVYKIIDMSLTQGEVEITIKMVPEMANLLIDQT